jgi:hypothetical protein
VVVEHREMKLRGGPFSWVLILFQLVAGFLMVVFALDQDFARGKVAFDGSSWRVAFGIVGVFLTYRGARALVRTINGATLELSPDHFRRVRINGTLLELIGVALLVAAWGEDVIPDSISFDSWARPLYVAEGILLVLTGLLQFLRPGTTPRQGLDPTSFPDPTEYPSPNE